MTEDTGAEGVRWDLSDLYAGANDTRLWADLDEAEAEADRFREAYRGRIADLDASTLHEAVSRLEGLEQRLGRAGAFIHLLHATNADDPEVGAALTRVEERGTAIGNRLLFFQLEWQALPEEAARTLLAEPALADYRHFLETARRYAPYRLSEPEERVLAEKQLTARSAWTRLFDETFTRLRFEVDGEALSEEAILARLKEEDRETRRRAAEAFTRGLDEQLPLLTHIFNTVLSDKTIEDRLLSPDDPLLPAQGPASGAGYPLRLRSLRPHPRHPAHRDLGRGPAHRSRGLRRFLRRHARHCRDVLRERVGRCPGGRRQDRGRLLPSGHTGRPSLRAGELHRHPGRRH
ncbi:MAG: hypothetical protein ABEK42_10005, partial [Thiohalorhabdaceae bacterium]